MSLLLPIASRLSAVVFLLCCACALPGRASDCVLPSSHIAHVNLALDEINMTWRDPGFHKDFGEPLFALPRLRAILAEPFDLPRMADEILRVSALEGQAAAWQFTAGVLGFDPPRIAAETSESTSSPPPPMDCIEDALSSFVVSASAAGRLLSAAFESVPPEERQYAAAAVLGGIFDACDDDGERRKLLELGIAAEAIERSCREQDAIDPEPGAIRLIDIVNAIDLSDVADAALIMDRALNELQRYAMVCTNWPAEPADRHLNQFHVRIGTPGDDVHDTSAVLILDPGGDDLYTGKAGIANGLLDRPLCLVLDLRGNDRYMGEGLPGPGTALFGLCLIRDIQGNDVHRTKSCGQGAALFGASLVEDNAGDDAYSAQAFAQAAAYAGVAILKDDAGHDNYDLGMCGQAYAGVRGMGLLVDREGADVYIAGRQRRDYGRHDEHFLSLAQGFSIGMRPFAGGGVAALVDLAGNDIYRADVYGQGVSYWYSAAFLLDCGGHDSYEVHEYGQGSGIHLSAGLLYDSSGDDRYFGYSLSQGNAHDYAVGMLLDRRGNDTYTADHYSQGRGINNSFGLLLDAEGRDAYFARQPDSCQGIGHDGGRREYGSIGMLLDLAGKDTYTCGAGDGARMKRPDFGIVYDFEE